MKFILSPTKTMKPVEGHHEIHEPYYPNKTNILLNELKSLSREELQTAMVLSDKLTDITYEMIQNHNATYPAILSYQGSSFKNMKLDCWSESMWQRSKNDIYILSALYGVSNAQSAVGLYRLDFTMKLKRNYYDYWTQEITDFFNQKNEPIINLASKEYAAMIDQTTLSVPFITIDFKESSDKGYVSKSTYAKIARGTMIFEILKRGIIKVGDLKKISFSGYTFNPELSSETLFLFTR